MPGDVYSVYILRCADGTYYTGSTNDVARRVRMHTERRGAKYTRGRLPVTLCYSEKVGTLGQALRREHEIKKLTRGEKESLFI